MEDNIKEYITVLGDTWDSIAYKIYNNSTAYKSLFDLNPNHVNTIVFPAGKIIKYKKINLQIDIDIAPWRR